MMKTLALIAAFLAAFFMTPAEAMVCFDQSGYERFKNQFQESEIANGSIGPGDELKMILLSNKDTGTWTMLIVREDGLMCPFSSGDEFKLIRPRIEGKQVKWTL
tara:strand:+ start:130 stop:441 length:312 start_codon:yes stop_codon:yes gene_type:complete